MSLTYKRLKTIMIGLIGIMFAGGWLATAGLSAEDGTAAQNNPAASVSISKIRPVGEGTATQRHVLAQDVFDVVGSLNSIDGNRVIVGDRAYTIASGVNASGIEKWYEVGLNLNDSGEVVALEIISTEPH